MPKLATRVNNAWRAFMGASPGAVAVSMGTVRPSETHQNSQRYRQFQDRELVLRYVKHVKVGVSRTAGAVAGTKLGFYRRGRGDNAGKGTAWRTRAVGRKELAGIVARAGQFAAKSASMDDGVEEITDPAHPLVSLLRNANPRDNGYALIERLQADLCLTGAHYWYPVRGPLGVPVEIWPFDSQFVRPIPDRERFIGAYIYGRAPEIETRYDADQIIPFHNPNPMGDPYHGRGDLAACVDDADLSVAFTQFACNMVQNSCQPGMVVSPKDGLSAFNPEQAKAIEADLNNRSGPMQAGINRVFNFPADVKWPQMTEREIDFLASDDKVRETIANAFDIPMALFTLEVSALASAAVAMQHWQIMGIRPRCRRIEDQINQRIPPLFATTEEADRGESLFVAFEEVVTEDQTVLTGRVVNLWNADLITFNEARVEAGMDADPARDGYKSELVKPPEAAFPGAFGGSNGSGDAGGAGADRGKGGRGVDGGTVAAVRAGVPGEGQLPRNASHKGLPVSGGGACQDCAKDGEGKGKGGGVGGDCIAQQIRAIRLENPNWPSERVHALAEDRCHPGSVHPGNPGGGAPGPSASPGATGARSMGETMFGAKCECHCCTRAAKDDDWRMVEVSERQLEAALRSVFQAFTGRVVESVGPSGGLSFDLGDNGAFNGALANAMNGPLGSMVLNGWRDGMASVGSRPNANPLGALTEAPQEYLSRYQDSLIGGITDTLKGRVLDSLAEGTAAGENQHQLKVRVADVMGTAADYGSERIARTETSRAYNASKVAAWKETGAVKGWKWSLSAAPCPECVELHDEVEGMADGYAPLGFPEPPGHPNCRCSMVAVFEGDE